MLSALKGASANLHIDRLTSLAGETEARAKAGKDIGMEQALEEIVAEFSRVARTLQRDLEQRPSRQSAAS